MDPVNHPMRAQRCLLGYLLAAMLIGPVSAGIRGEQSASGVEAPVSEPSSLEPLVSQSPGPEALGEAPGSSAAQPKETETVAKVDLQSARDLFRLYGIDESHFRRLTDRCPWQESENELLMKVLYRLRQFRLMDIQRWSKGELETLRLAQEPDRWRGEVFHISGRARGVVELVPVPEVVERFEIDRYYQCKVQLQPGGQPAVVFAQRVPRAWKLSTAIDEAVSAYGVFLKLASAEQTQPTPVLVTLRLAWHPPTTLGKLGMDMGLFDDIPPEQWSIGSARPGGQRPKVNPRELALGHRDRECFYQMLAAVGRAKPGELLAEAAQELRATGQEQSSVVPLFNDPANQRAKLFLLSGWVRRAELVRVSDEDIRSRFGIDHYYNLYLFTEDSLDNPLVLCVRELPQGMPLSESPNYVEQIRAAAFFYKTWAYRSDLSTDPTAEGVPWQ